MAEIMTAAAPASGTHAEAALARRPVPRRRGHRAVPRLARLSPGVLLFGTVAVSLGTLGAISVLGVL